MAMRMQEHKEDNWIVAKLKPTMNLFLTCLDKFFIRAGSDCVEKAGDIKKHRVEQIGQVLGNLTHRNTIKTQCRDLKDGKKMQFWT